MFSNQDESLANYLSCHKSFHNFIGEQTMFSEFPQICPKKLLCDKLFPYTFSKAVGAFWFPLPCCHTQFTSQIAFMFCNNLNMTKIRNKIYVNIA